MNVDFFISFSIIMMLLSFVSMKPKCKDSMILLAKKNNKRIEELCHKINKQVNVEALFLKYSDEMFRVDIDSADNLNYLDAWHPY